MKYIIFSLIPALCWLQSCNTPGSFSIDSPEGNTTVNFELDDEGKPYYEVTYMGKSVITPSFLGFELEGAPDMMGNFKVIEHLESTFDETWEQPWGEEQFVKNHYNELSVLLEEKTAAPRQLRVVFRVYDDGLGFRYEFPEQEHLDSIFINEEHSGFNLAGDFTAWWIPVSCDDRYECLYSETPASEMDKVHTPVTFKAADDLYLSIHEAALTNYSSMAILNRGDNKLSGELLPCDKDGGVKVYQKAPFHTPWRTIQLAERAGGLIESNLILNLNEPNKLGDVSWFKPGKYVGIWWEMHINKSTWSSGEKHGATTENTRKYIDFAAEHGFDGVLVEGWNTGWDGNWMFGGTHFDFTQPHPDYDVEELSRYAAEKGVYIVGHHETGADVDNYESQLEDAFDFLQKYGMKAVKTGYVENGNLLVNGWYHHGQAYVNHFQRVIDIAAEHQVAIVAHEPIKATGKRRTYPNMISREGARGMEFNAWAGDGGNPPDHEINLAFTRILGGPMDYTPGAFDIRIPSQPNNQVNTTLAKQLALYVTIYSPMQMACDLPENYMKYPDAFQWIEEVGVDWETTKVLEGAIGDYLTIARKEKDTGTWFIGAITDENPRETTISLDFLDEGKTYYARIYRDADDAHYRDNPEAYEIEETYVDSEGVLELKLAASGGAAIKLAAVK